MKKLSKRWKNHFMKQAYLASEMSKDTTKVGSIVVGKSKEILSTGFNGFPKKVKELDIRKLPEYKLFYTCHAEQNALDLAKSPVKGASLFTTHFPCANCTRSIIQRGIKRVYYSEKMESKTWKQSLTISNQMLLEAKIKIIHVPYTEKFLCAEEETSSIKNL